MGLISHLKCCFKGIQEKNLRNFSLWSLSFVCCRFNVYRSAFFFRNLHCPEKLLVTRLYFINKSFFRRAVAVNWKCSEKRCLKYFDNLRYSGTGVFLRICKIFKNIYYAEHLKTQRLFMRKYLLYGIFGNCLPGKKVITLVFTEEAEKLRFQS